MATSRLVFLLRRRAELSRAEFQDYWWKHHAPLVAARAEVLGIARYQQVHTVASARPGGPEHFDGIAELWFDGPAPTGSADERARAGAALLADEATFIDLSASPIWMATEHVMHDRPHQGLRLNAALRRLAGVSREHFTQRWHRDHGPLALAHPDVFGFGHYVQLHTPADAEAFPLRLRRGAPEPYDGVSEIWLEPTTASAEHAEAVRAMVRADEADFLDIERSVLWLSEVRTVLAR